MLSHKKKKMVEGVIYCAKCEIPMKKIVLASYEYVQGYPLKNVPAYKCQKCGEEFFTEEQAKEMGARTEELKEYVFGFKRSVTVSGRSLVISVPHELAEYLHIKQGQKIKIVPIAKEGFMVKKEK